jgi:polysaccharide biosynthesis/export protein
VGNTAPLAPGDEIAVQVFQEPDLSVARTRIDESGMVSLPLLGEMRAADLTAAQFGTQVAGRLGQRYLRNPKVTVSVLSAVVAEASVEGEVNAPGVFPIRRDETLLRTLARARSPTRTARNDEVFVFRRVNGQRLGARFDLDQIRTGRAADPRILGGDVVVVGYSSAKGRFRDFLQAAPLLNLFTVF